MKSIAPALALVLGAFGAVATHPVAALEREDDELRTFRAANSRGENPAVLALLEAAERELGAGQPEQASALLERALRIEPRNPTVWHYLGLANLELGNTAQADAMASKSRSLVEGDAGDAGDLRLRDWASRTLIEPARSVIDNWREPPESAAQPRRWPSTEVAPQPRRSVQPPTLRQLREAYNERVRRERAARRAERAQSISIVDGRQYRRLGSNEAVRRQR